MKYLSALTWILLPTVMFGGYALLNRIAEGATSQELVLFRAGHAHAGVLLLLGLAYFHYLRQTAYGAGLRVALSIVVLLSVLLQSGGFFVQLAGPTYKSLGHGSTVTGAIGIGFACLVLAVGMLRSGKTSG